MYNSKIEQFITPVSSKYNEHTFFYEKNCECDKPFPNNHNINKIHKGNVMNKEKHNYLETEQGGMTVILEFPEKTEDEKYAKNEVKNILSVVLQQYLTNVS